MKASWFSPPVASPPSSPGSGRCFTMFYFLKTSSKMFIIGFFEKITLQRKLNNSSSPTSSPTSSALATMALLLAFEKGFRFRFLYCEMFYTRHLLQVPLRRSWVFVSRKWFLLITLEKEVRKRWLVGAGNSFWTIMLHSRHLDNKIWKSKESNYLQIQSNSSKNYNPKKVLQIWSKYGQNPTLVNHPLLWPPPP